MRGSIIKRGSGYSIVINLGTDPTTGKRKQQWLSGFRTKKVAEERLTQILHQLDTGTFMRPGKTTVAEFLERWLDDYAKPNLSPRGFERYREVITKQLIPALGPLTLTQLRPEHIQKHYAARLRAGISPQYDHAVLHKALQTALKWGLVSRNVADGVDVPRARRPEMQTWNEDEVNCFLEAAKDSPYYALFHTALFTGARRSELLALRWQDVNLLLGQISVSRSLHQLKDGSYVFTQPKSAKSKRTIALSPSAILTLRDHRGKQEAMRAMLGVPLKDDDLIFSTLESKPLQPSTISYAWRTLAARAGVKVIRFHDARHTHASLLLKQGIHPKIVQERLGHATIAMTLDTYSHVIPGLQEAAAESFDRLLRRENEAVEKLR